jgi:D-alanyl-lipoteichoic acid acyltransferase DltB (MBOAT superfamily)
MLFNSLSFLYFMTFTYLVYVVLPHRLQNIFLLLASYFFYSWANWRFLGLIVLSTAVSYTTAIKIEDARTVTERRLYFFGAVAFALGQLGIFKYYNFFSESFTDLFGALGVSIHWPELHLLLPIGISFYTFQALGYTIEVHRGTFRACRSPLDFALFVGFFPLLLSGPIERANRLLPQIQLPRTVTTNHLTSGLWLIVFGLFKKMAIADGLSRLVDPVFSGGGGYSGFDIILATYAFTLQLYCDFSGYTDIARGVAQLMGFSVVENFRTPFYAESPSDFWTRWHISLSSWVKDYVYYPLALHYFRLKDGFGNEYKPHIYSMLLMGLWHGAAWTYVLWGLYNGFMLIVWGAVKLPSKLKRLPRVLSIFIYFQVTVGCMLIFRAGSVRQIGRFIGTVFTDFGGFIPHIVPPPAVTLLSIPLFLVLDYLAFLKGTERFFETWPAAARGGLYAILFALVLMGGSNAPAQFIYFNF